MFENPLFLQDSGLSLKAKEEEEKQRKLIQSRTVIIEGIMLDLGITEAEIRKFILDKLLQLGERTKDLDII